MHFFKQQTFGNNKKVIALFLNSKPGFAHKLKKNQHRAKLRLISDYFHFDCAGHLLRRGLAIGTSRFCLMLAASFF